MEDSGDILDTPAAARLRAKVFGSGITADDGQAAIMITNTRAIVRSTDPCGRGRWTISLECPQLNIAGWMSFTHFGFSRRALIKLRAVEVRFRRRSDPRGGYRAYQLPSISENLKGAIFWTNDIFVVAKVRTGSGRHLHRRLSSLVRFFDIRCAAVEECSWWWSLSNSICWMTAVLVPDFHTAWNYFHEEAVLFVL